MTDVTTGQVNPGPPHFRGLVGAAVAVLVLIVGTLSIAAVPPGYRATSVVALAPRSDAGSDPGLVQLIAAKYAAFAAAGSTGSRAARP